MKDLELYKSSTLLPLNLQLFAEPIDPIDPVDPPNPTDPVDPPVPPKDPVKTYTQDELEEIIKQRVAREKKAAEKAIEESKKLAKMNEEEKRKYEVEKLQNELEELRKEKNYNSMLKEASKMLSAEKLPDGFSKFVYADQADVLKENFEEFKGLMSAYREAIVNEIMRDKTPNAPKQSQKANPDDWRAKLQQNYQKAKENE